MLLIWGWKARYKTLTSGHFFCPGEEADRMYALREVRRWFTFFFIPMIPLKVLGEFVECAECGRTYEKDVLTLPTTAQVVDNLTTIVRHAVVAVVRADGVADPQEKAVALEVIRQFASLDYNESHFETDLSQLPNVDLTNELAQAAGQLNEHGREALLTSLLRVAMADGSLDPAEASSIEGYGAALGMTAAHVRGLMHEATANR